MRADRPVGAPEQHLGEVVHAPGDRRHGRWIRVWPATIPPPLTGPDEHRGAAAGSVGPAADGPGAGRRLPQVLLVGERRHRHLRAVAAVERRASQPGEQPLCRVVVLLEQRGEAWRRRHGHRVNRREKVRVGHRLDRSGSAPPGRRVAQRRLLCRLRRGGMLRRRRRRRRRARHHRPAGGSPPSSSPPPGSSSCGHGSPARAPPAAIAGAASTVASSGHEVVTLDVVGGPDRSAMSSSPANGGARSAGTTTRFPPGTRVLITGVEGTTLIVWPAEGYLPVEEER